MEPLTLVIPTFNEADTIVAVILKIPRRPIVRTSLSPMAAALTEPGIARDAGTGVVNAGRGYGRACVLGAEKAHPASSVTVFMDGDGADRGDLIDEIARPVLDGTRD